MTKLFHGDTVIAKDSVHTDGKWEKGVIHQINDDYYVIRFYDGDRLIVAKDNPLLPFRVEEHEDLNLYIYSFLIGKKKEYGIYLTRRD